MGPGRRDQEEADAGLLIGRSGFSRLSEWRHVETSASFHLMKHKFSGITMSHHYPSALSHRGSGRRLTLRVGMAHQEPGVSSAAFRHAVFL